MYEKSMLAKNVEVRGILLGFVPIQWMHHLERRKDGQQPMQEENAAAMQIEDAAANIAR
jgi:hypothetical protein